VTVRVLVVARGYPSFDAPGRGSFVADHVEALHASGAQVEVVSFETVQVRGDADTRRERVEAAESHWAVAVRDPTALTVGHRFGAAAVPVARLPVARTWTALDGSEAPDMRDRHAGPLLAFGKALAARAVADGRPYDVIHANNGLPDGAAAMHLAQELGLPLVVTEHDSTLPRRLTDPAAAGVYRTLLAAAWVVAVSDALARRIADALGASGDELAAVRGVLPNVVPLDRFEPAAEEPRDLDELLFVGARAAHKGFDTLLRAVALARQQRPALHLRAIGPATPDDDESWGALARDLGIADAAVIEPAAEREEVAAAMRRAGVFVHPSPFETFGMVAAEALASGLPVAATPSGGVEAIVGLHGDGGEIAADPGPDALAAAIVRLRDRLETVDRAALRAPVEAAFAPAVVAERTLALYRAAGAGAGSSAASAVIPPASPRQSGIAAALVVAGTRQAADRVRTLPAGSLPIRVVGPPTPTPPSERSGGLLRRLGRRSSDARSRQLDAIRAGWRAVRPRRSGGRPVVVAVDVDDVASIADALGDEGLRHLAPGSLRWLADVRDASRGAMGG
jgi:glycosyltransferase involved in cell wall biosynthesis